MTLYFGLFADLEKAFDKAREMIRWAVHKLGVDEWLVTAILSVHMGARTVVRTVLGNHDNRDVVVGMHQGSALSPLPQEDVDVVFVVEVFVETQYSVLTVRNLCTCSVVVYIG